MTENPRAYPTYKPSGVEWLGDVPEHWEVRRLKDVGSLKGGAGFPHSYQGESTKTLPFFKVGDMGRERNARGMEKWQHTVSLDTAEKLGAYVFPPNAIVFAKVGAALMLNRRRLIIRPSCIDNNMMGFVPSEVSHDWMLYWLGIIDLGMLANPGAVPSVNEAQVGQIVTLVPPILEQRKIVRYLGYVDRRARRYISAKRKLIALLEEEKQFVVSQAVTRGLDPHVPLKPSGVDWLGDMPAHWEVQRVKFLYREADERSATGSEGLMSVSHKTGVTPRKRNVTMFLAGSNVGYKICRPGDIVVNTMWAYMAALGVARQEGLVSPSYGVYRPTRRDLLNNDYVDSLLRTEAHRSAYLSRSKGITASRLRLYPESFLGMSLLCPPVAEQAAIVAYLDKATADIDGAIARTGRQIELVQEYRTRLIADVVTGKLDVREVAAQLPDESGEADPIDEDGLILDNMDDGSDDAGQPRAEEPERESEVTP